MRGESLPVWRTKLDSSPCFLSIIQAMKDKTWLCSLLFVLHPSYEGQNLPLFLAFCPSSKLWRTKPASVPCFLSLIQAMKGKTQLCSLHFVLHPSYEKQNTALLLAFYPSSKLWKTKHSSAPCIVSFIAPQTIKPPLISGQLFLRGQQGRGLFS